MSSIQSKTKLMFLGAIATLSPAVHADPLAANTMVVYVGNVPMCDRLFRR